MTKHKTRKESAELLAKLAEEGVRQQSPMTSRERQLEEEARRRNQQEMDKWLAEQPPEDGKPKVCPRCGKRVRVRARGLARSFQSLWGTHTVWRDYYFCEGCKEGFFPKDEALGLPKEGNLTEEVESRIADFAVNDAYAEAEARWRFHYRFLPVSENQFRQVARRLGEQVEGAQLTLLEGAVKPPPLTASERLYVLQDGGMVPMRQGWRETKVGVCFREENHLAGTQTHRGSVSEARYTAALGNQEEFKAQLAAALEVENAVKAALVVWLADGAPGNWLLARALAPEATQVLDWYHAVEHAMTCAKLLLGEAGLPSWQRRIEALLLGGDPDALRAELEACLPLASTAQHKEALKDLLRYYSANRDRMAYADFKAKGLLIGSGIVESAHRHVIQTRMKKAGQHWSERGARQMARLRAAYRTAGPQRFYAAIRWAYRSSRRVAHTLPKVHRPDLRRAGMANR